MGLRGPLAIRDLGIQMDLSGQFETHIYKTISKAKQKFGWVNRAFHNKSIGLRRKLWRSYLEPLLDYGLQVYCPVNPTLIAQLETVQQSYTFMTDNLKFYNYWDRLRLMRMKSAQRRQERYWKI